MVQIYNFLSFLKLGFKTQFCKFEFLVNYGLD